MAPPSRPAVRSRGRTIAALACILIGTGAFLYGYSGVDVSLPRYVALVAGGALLVAGLLLRSMRAAAIVAGVFVAGVSLQGPLPADAAQALRVLNGVRVPGYASTGGGFVGPTRDFPYRAFVGPPKAIGPLQVKVPERFELDPANYTDSVGPYESAVAAGPSNLLVHEGYTRIATWRGPRPGGRTCILELEVADPHGVSKALAATSESLRSKFAGNAIIRLISSCVPAGAPGLGPVPGSGPQPSAKPSVASRGGPG
jgi:hypothetical protein